MRRGYDREESGIGRSYDEIKGVTMPVSRDIHRLGKITTGKKVEKIGLFEYGQGRRHGGVKSISSAGVVELRIHVSVSVMMSGVWLSVRSSVAVSK